MSPRRSLPKRSALSIVAGCCAGEVVGTLQQSWDAMLAVHAQDKLGGPCLLQSYSGHKQGAPTLAAKHPGRPIVVAIGSLGHTDDPDGLAKAFNK